MGLLPYFAVLAELPPASHATGFTSQGDTGRPAAAGRHAHERGIGVRIISEFGWITGRVPG